MGIMTLKAGDTEGKFARLLEKAAGKLFVASRLLLTAGASEALVASPSGRPSWAKLGAFETAGTAETV